MSDIACLPGAVTVDAVARGALHLAQLRKGYRFNIDALILAHFAASSVGSPPDYVVDLGSGCGVIGLLLARRWTTTQVLLVELQSELAELAQQNIARNGLSERVRLVAGDLRQSSCWSETKSAHVLVVTNPPFYPLERGRVSANRSAAEAKHELTCTLEQLLNACREGMASGQRLALIHITARQLELENGLAAAGFALERRRLVRSIPERPAQRILCIARRRNDAADENPDRDVASSGQPLMAIPCTDPPLLIHERPGVYSRELSRILGDE